MKQWLYL